MEFEAGMTRRLADKAGRVLPELAADRFVAVPFRHRATDPRGFYNDFSLGEMVNAPGRILSVDNSQGTAYHPSRHRASEGWAWTHGGHALGIFSFSQENMLFSVVSQVDLPDGKGLRLGGAAMIDGEPAALGRIAPGESVDLGLIRYQTVSGRLRRGGLRLSKDAGRKGLPLSSGLQSARALGATL